MDHQFVDLRLVLFACLIPALAFTVPIYNGITSPLLFRDLTPHCVDEETELRGGKESVHFGIPTRLSVVSEPHNCPFLLVLKVKLPQLVCSGRKCANK